MQLCGRTSCKVLNLYYYCVDEIILISLWRYGRSWTRFYLSACFSPCIINFCKKAISKTNLWTFAKIYTRHCLHTALEKVNFWCSHIQYVLANGPPKYAIFSQPFPKWHKRCPLANHMIVIVDRGSTSLSAPVVLLCYWFVKPQNL